MPTFRENYLCSRSAFPIQSCIPILKPLVKVVFEILRSKRIGVTSLTFQGHVTSSVTWPFDSPYTISYWWFFGTMPLSLTVFEIFNVECNAIVAMTLMRPLNKGYSFWYQSISHVRLPRALNSNFCSRTHRLATIRYITSQTTTDRRTQQCTNSRPLVRSDNEKHLMQWL